VHLDVQDLRNFYYRNALGRAVQTQLRSRLAELWPDVKGQTVVGYGFAAPVLRPHLKPLETGHVDRLVLLHGLETSEQPSLLLEEVWRVLGPGGKVVFIVPNRGGMWSRRDATPFGYGRPYTSGQLETQLRKHQFLPERQMGALYQFPSHRRVWMKSARLFDRIGRNMPTVIASGALIVEASKRVWPPKGRVSRVPARQGLPVLEGLPKPVAGRVG